MAATQPSTSATAMPGSQASTSGPASSSTQPSGSTTAKSGAASSKRSDAVVIDLVSGKPRKPRRAMPLALRQRFNAIPTRRTRLPTKARSRRFNASRVVPKIPSRNLVYRFARRDFRDKIELGKREREQRQHLKNNKKIANELMARRNKTSMPPPPFLHGQGYSGYGNGYTETRGPAKILYPHEKPRSGRRTTASLKYSRKDMRSQAEQPEELVPVRLDIDWDKIKLRDTFTYNLHERIIGPDYFATQMVEDMGLKMPVDRPVLDEVIKQLKDQLAEYFPFAYSNEDALDPELPYSAYKNDEMRILVKLNITIGAHTLVDQFEWEINNPLNSPEEFAIAMARDLSLSGEFTTAIAHCIREQSQAYTRSLYVVGHPFDGRPIEDPDILSSLLPSPLPSVFRPQQQAKDFAPYLYENTEAELDRSETIFSREQRRQKRSVNRRGGPMLPDLKEKPRTIRTLIVSSVLPGAAADMDETRLYKRATTTVGATGRARRVLRDGELSDSERDSDDSAPDSPAMMQLQGTARTRGMRGAANIAAQRMANLGRSETPELTIHHHETRTSRRMGREATREMTEDPQQLVVTLRVNPARLRKLFLDARARPPHAPSGLGTPRASHTFIGSMGPPLTPSGSTQHLPARPTTTPSSSYPPAQAGASRGLPSTAPGKATPGKSTTPPLPPPDWLVTALRDLLKQYPNDLFEGFMRYTAVDAETETPIPQGKTPPPNVKHIYLPRIRCHDCPGKLYNPGAEMTVANFEVHLKNRQHREKVDARLAKNGRKSSAGQASTSAGPSAS